MKTTIVIHDANIGKSDLSYPGESGIAKLALSLAVSRKPEFGETPDEYGRVTDWYNVEFWGTRAASLYDQIAADRVRSVSVVGSLVLRKWVSKDGQRNGTSIDVRAHDVSICKWKDSDSPSAGEEEEAETAPAPQSKTKSSAKSSKSSKSSSSRTVVEVDDDEEEF